MKKIILILCAFCVIATNNNAFAESPTPKKKAISEGTEWSNMWMVSTNNHDVPRVLIMGDSHVERYYQVVNAKIGKKALCCKFTTSRSLGDPSLIAQLKALFFSYKFEAKSPCCGSRVRSIAMCGVVSRPRTSSALRVSRACRISSSIFCFIASLRVRSDK